VNGANFEAAINAELRKISTFYVDKEEELDVSCIGVLDWILNCQSMRRMRIGTFASLRSVAGRQGRKPDFC